MRLVAVGASLLFVTTVSRGGLRTNSALREAFVGQEIRLSEVSENYKDISSGGGWSFFLSSREDPELSDWRGSLWTYGELRKILLLIYTGGWDDRRGSGADYRQV